MRYLATVLLAAATTTTLLNPGTESKWKVTKGSVEIGTVTVLTSKSAARAEWKSSAKSAPEVFIGTDGKSWMRATGGDVDVATLDAVMPPRLVAPALLIPYGGKEPSSAKYERDEKGVSKITIKSGHDTYTVTRVSVAPTNADASNFEVRPRKSASARLARLSGNLLGPSDTSVGSTAGARGVEPLKLKDGGDYVAVAQVENRDAKWHEKLDTALAEFQKSGKVGRNRGGE